MHADKSTMWLKMHQDQALQSFKWCMQNSSKSLYGWTLLNFAFNLKTTFWKNMAIVEIKKAKLHITQRKI